MSSNGEPSSKRAMRLLWNPLWGEYTAQAPDRMHRREGASDCPFCADLSSGRVASGVQTWSRPNDFPGLTPPSGECFILIYSRDHERKFSNLSVDEAVHVVELWRQVYDDLSPRYPCVMTWETSGAEIGQTQRHPHGQTFAISIIPALLEREMDAFQRAANQGESCPLCATVAAEERSERVVYAGQHWVAWVPEWARYPYQTQVAPRQHFSAMDGFEPSGPAARELAALLPALIRSYDRVWQSAMPYMLALHQLADPLFHFHVEVLPVGRAPGKLKLAASSEMAWGFWLNDSLPEDKAAELRPLLREELGRAHE